MTTRQRFLSLAVLTVSACSGVTVGGGMDRGQVDKISASGKVEYDLTKPRTAQELGMPADMTSGIIDRPHGGNNYLHVRFLLPGGAVFTSDRAFGVGVAAPLTNFGDNSIVVNTREMTREAVFEAIHSRIGLLGLDPHRVDIYFDDVALNPPFGDGRVFTGKRFGYLACDVEILPAKDDVAINYSFTWDTGVTPEPSSKSS